MSITTMSYNHKARGSDCPHSRSTLKHIFHLRSDGLPHNRGSSSESFIIVSNTIFAASSPIFGLHCMQGPSLKTPSAMPGFTLMDKSFKHISRLLRVVLYSVGDLPTKLRVLHLVLLQQVLIITSPFLG